MKTILGLILTCLAAAAPAWAAGNSNHPWYLEAQTDTGLGNGYNLWQAPLDYGNGFGSGAGNSLAFGKDLDDGPLGPVAIGGFYEDQGFSAAGGRNFGRWVAYHKLAVTVGYHLRLWGPLSASADAGLGAFDKTITGADPGNQTGGLCLADLGLQADLYRGLYLGPVVDVQELDTNKAPAWTLLLIDLRVAVGYRF